MSGKKRGRPIDGGSLNRERVLSHRDAIPSRLEMVVRRACCRVVIVGVPGVKEVLMLPIKSHKARPVGKLYLKDPGVEFLGNQIPGTHESCDTGCLDHNAMESHVLEMKLLVVTTHRRRSQPSLLHLQSPKDPNPIGASPQTDNGECLEIRAQPAKLAKISRR